MFIQTEATPNPATLKFLPGKPVLPGGTREYRDAETAAESPLAEAYAAMRAAELMVHEAARLYEADESCGAEANMAKMLSADASWEAANACIQTHGGFGFAAEYDIERKFRETRLYQVAPISTNMILAYLAEHVLGLPRSY